MTTHYDSQGRRILHSHPSTWEAEVEELRRDYSLIQIDRNNLRNLLDEAEDKADKLEDKLEDAEAEAKALRARVAELETALTWYRDQHRIASKPTIDAEWAATRLKTDAGERARATLQQEAKP